MSAVETKLIGRFKNFFFELSARFGFRNGFYDDDGEVRPTSVKKITIIHTRYEALFVHKLLVVYPMCSAVKCMPTKCIPRGTRLVVTECQTALISRNVVHVVKMRVGRRRSGTRKYNLNEYTRKRCYIRSVSSR